jgi:ferrous iron transport protein B
MRLSELNTGEKAVVVKVLGHGGFRKRIIEMGFIRGKVVKSVQNAPLLDPVKYRVMSYEVSLRRSEAENIEVISITEAMKADQGQDLQGLVEEEILRKSAFEKRKTINVALVGNPNCGKTTLFNRASGAHEHEGNYSGVTVDAKEGSFKFNGYTIRLVDLPGTYSLSAYSPEELYVRKHITDDAPDVVLNVVDSSNLERNLFLTTQLIDMNVRMVVALNMFDELEDKGNKLDYKQLGKLLGVPMVPTVARKGSGIEKLFKTIISIYENTDFLTKDGKVKKRELDELHDIYHKFDMDHHAIDDFREDKKVTVSRHIHVNHGQPIEDAINAIRSEIILNEKLRAKYSTRFLSIKLLEGDKDIENIISGLPNALVIFNVRDKVVKDIQNELKEDAESAVTNAKYGFISGALAETFKESKKHKATKTGKIDKILLNKYLGYPIFLLFMFVMFECTFVLGEYPKQWIESLVDLLSFFVRENMAPGPLKDLLVDGIIGGVGGVIVFLPNILILYFFISIMEDTGYMARAAFIMDKLMHKMGLHGKSFIPMIMGFGCTVPAIMATRTIESRNSRLITILVTPLMSCSARLPVYLLLAGAFFPEHAGLVLFGVYLFGIILSIIFARIFKKLFFKGEDLPFVMELPPYRKPTMKATFRHMWEKGKQYLRKMGSVILFASILIWFLGYYPRYQAFVDNPTPENHKLQHQNSYIGKVGHFVEPALKPLGFDWKIGVSLVTGITAKEVVVSTMSVLYTKGDSTLSLAERLRNEKYADGAPVYNSAVALALIVFVLIYMPCIATITAIKQETRTWRWALFEVFYTIALAWIAAFVVYRVGLLIL